MHNKKNASNIANSIGRCLLPEEDNMAKHRYFMRLNLELDVSVPLVEVFWWTRKSGEDKWVIIKYERLSDVCYGCGKLGHTSINYGEVVSMKQINPEFPTFGSWLGGTRPQTQNRSWL